MRYLQWLILKETSRTLDEEGEQSDALKETLKLFITNPEDNPTVRNLILEIILKIDIESAWTTQKHGVCPSILIKTIHNTHLFDKQIKRLKMIGSGSFGKVYVSE